MPTSESKAPATKAAPRMDARARASHPAERPDRSPVPYEPETQRIVTVFGSNARSGPWEPPERLDVFSVFGGVKLDFREAALYEGVTAVRCFAIFGGIELVVPPDLEVDANGTGFFGGFEHMPAKRGLLSDLGRRLRGEPRPVGSPEEDPAQLRVRGWAIFGGVTVRDG
jgi:hypothetical protein